MRDQLDDLAANEKVLGRLLDGKSTLEVRAICIEALRRWRKGPGQNTPRVTMHGDLGLNVVELLASGSDTKVNPVVAKEVFLSLQQSPVIRAVMDFVWWLMRAGLARPEGFTVGQLTAFHMTEAGLRFLDAATDHPLAPEFLSRLRVRQPDIPETILLLIEDAQACFEAALFRPAVVLLGVAYETAVELVLEDLATKSLCDERALRAQPGERIATLKKQLNKLHFIPDQRRLTGAALDFADHLRLRRNDAAHTKLKWPFDTNTEIEELLVSASRHLPFLWAMTKADVP